MPKPLTLFKFMPLNRMERVLDVLLNERLYCSAYKDLNDPFEGQFLEEYTIGPEHLGAFLSQLVGNKFTARSSVDALAGNQSTVPRICSLSGNSRDVRLWSHYADSHRGVALEIDFSGIEQDVQRVSYTANIAKYPGTILGGANITKVLTEKTHHWQYEDEYRILTSSEYFSISGRLIGVYVGIRADPKLVQLVHKATHDKTKVHFCELNLETTEIQEKTNLNLGSLLADGNSFSKEELPGNEL